MKKFFLNSLLILLSTISEAKDLDQKIYTSLDGVIEITSGSTEYFQIQNQIENILNTNYKLSEVLCSVLKWDENVNYSIGLSLEKSTEFIKKCKQRYAETPMSKIFKKRYFKYFQNHSKLGKFSSWTTQDNITFLNETNFTNPNNLQNSLVHELAIAFDVKNGFYYNNAKHFEPQIFNHLNANQESELDKAFKASKFNPIKYTFVALRGFSVESNDFYNRALKDQKFCQHAFIEIFNQFGFDKKFTNSFFNGIDDIANMVSKYNTPDDLAKTIEFLLSDQLQINNQMTFCQYMATPLFSSVSTYSFAGGGPRPNIGGGWATGSKTLESISDSKLNSKLTDGELQDLKSNSHIELEIIKNKNIELEITESGKVYKKNNLTR